LITVRLPGARFVVVGADPPRSLLSRPTRNVTIVGRVADVAPYFAQATIVVAPLRCGGGTPVKVLEAMAYGVPVVSTSRGCEGLAVRDRESVLLADTPDAFAEAVYELSVTPALADRLSRAAADVIRAEYDWARIGDGIHRLLAPATAL
jgi:glycosyltransferase involved in cell wall biosynthesis